MARPSRLQIAKDDIFKLFDSLGPAVYRADEIGRLLEEHREFWRLAVRTSLSGFISFLCEKGKMEEHTLEAENYNQSAKRYSWGEASFYTLALSLRPKSYLSHGTAVFLHGLNDLVPSVAYVNKEQSPKPDNDNDLRQSSLDLAFSRKQRISKMSFVDAEGRKAIVINGKNTGRLDVEDIQGPAGETLQATSVERTLIDIVVRPAYAGGIYQVLDAYRGAIGKMSVNRLRAILRQLDYTYPYHQAIGFLMERAGYTEKRCGMMKEMGLNHDFYLTHAMDEKEFNEAWRLHIPRGF